MNTVSLALFKQHVRADDFADDDQYLQQCLSAATELVVSQTNRTLEELVALGPDGINLPPSIVQAILLVGGSMYDHRENDAPTQYHEIPLGAEAIIKRFRRLVVKEKEE